MPCDVGKKKVDVLKKRLENFGSDIEVQTLAYHLREPNAADEESIKARDMVILSDIVIIAADDNTARIQAEDLCEFGEEIEQLSIGIAIGENGTATYECAFDAKTPKHQKETTGYGNGSYASIVMEATAAGFGMLLAKFFSPDTDFVYLGRDYENYRPTEQYFSLENPEN